VTKGRNPKELAFDTLFRFNRACSTKEITAAINTETGEAFKADTIRKALQRDRRVTTTADVPVKWIVKAALTVTHLSAVPAEPAEQTANAA